MLSEYFLNRVIVTSQNTIHHVKWEELVCELANHLFSSHIDLFLFIRLQNLCILLYFNFQKKLFVIVTSVQIWPYLLAPLNEIIFNHYVANGFIFNIKYFQDICGIFCKACNLIIPNTKYVEIISLQMPHLQCHHAPRTPASCQTIVYFQ